MVSPTQAQSCGSATMFFARRIRTRTSIHRYLGALRRSGFTGASEPVGIDADGRERLRFIPGDVAIPPYPSWVQADSALGSVARLLRRLHDASVGLDLGDNDVERRRWPIRSAAR